LIYRSLTLRLDGVERVQDRVRAGAPEAAVVFPCFLRRLEEGGGVAAPVSMEEPGCGGPLSHEGEVDVGAVSFHIRERSAVAVDAVEGGVELDGDVASWREQVLEGALGLVGVALVLVRLGCVELDEANVAAVGEDDRVAVEDAGDGSGGRRARVRSAAGKREGEERGDEENAETHVHDSGSPPRRRQVALSAWLRRRASAGRAPPG
jgi:hypothetical protein